ncbi:MAG TPA: right-handed parallel beta-helix repeat-containing protein [Phycisphaerae bacterium]|nr:right-handed parallel beta-helix repeat-containing protein [Phycisphaerae bacterium]
MSAKSIGALAVAVLVASSAGVWATTYYVNGPCGNDGWSGTDPNCVSPNGPKATIQTAIGVTSNGDTVIVAEATYYETIAFGGKSIVLRSDDPNDPNVVAATVIDANDANSSVVTFAGSEDPNTVLTGFTITRGRPYGDGAGIMGLDPNDPNNRTEATISKCVITGNRAVIDYNGGGIAYCDGDIIECENKDNSADKGGGLYRCNGKISNCLIVGNVGTYDGGGLYDCDGELAGNVIAGNTSDEGNGGGLLLCDGTITDCIIAGNHAYQNGGGLALCNASISECTISGNYCEGEGGGLYNCGDMTDCVVTGNEDGGVAFENVGGNRTLTRCLISGNSHGSGISYDFSGAVSRTLALTDCVIAENENPGGETRGGGAYFRYDNGDPNCDGAGAGTLIVNNCTFRGNHAVYGGGMYVWGYCSPMLAFISNTILYGNDASYDDPNNPNDNTGQQIYVNTDCNHSCTPTPSVSVSYCDVEEGTDGVYQYDPNDPNDPGIFTWSNNIDDDPEYASVSGSTGNWLSDGSYDPNTFEVTFTDSSSSWTSDALVGKVINPDTAQDRRYVVVGNTSATVRAWVDWPTFTNQESWVDLGDGYVILDYHLTANSPCVDAGNPNGSYGGQLDIDGQPRVMGVEVDMGADEYGMSLVSSEPPADGSLPKTQNNLILCVFDRPITLPGSGNPLVIKQMMDPSDPNDPNWNCVDVSETFTYSIDTDDPNGCTLEARETDPNDPNNHDVLPDLTWYQVESAPGWNHVLPFQFEIYTLVGDCNNSGRVTTADYSCVEAALGQRGDLREDLNGSGRVTTADKTVVKENMGHRAPAKPSLCP